MQHQRLKVSASGQELAGDMLFRARFGFSGTPNDLLPVELGKCGYEPGSEGEIMHTLTDSSIVSGKRFGRGLSSPCLRSLSLFRHVSSRPPLPLS